MRTGMIFLAFTALGMAGAALAYSSLGSSVVITGGGLGVVAILAILHLTIRREDASAEAGGIE